MSACIFKSFFFTVGKYELWLKNWLQNENENDMNCAWPKLYVGITENLFSLKCKNKHLNTIFIYWFNL